MSLSSLTRSSCQTFNSLFASARYLNFVLSNPSPNFEQKRRLHAVSMSVRQFLDWRSPSPSHHASVQPSTAVSELFKRKYSKIAIKNAIDSGRRSRFRVPNKVVTQFRIRLELKQKLHQYYGMKRNYLNYVPKEAKKRSTQVLIQLLEVRLDTILVRMGLALTIPGARQLISHGHILVNDRIMNVPKYHCKPGDIISVEDGQRSMLTGT